MAEAPPVELRATPLRRWGRSIGGIVLGLLNNARMTGRMAATGALAIEGSAKLYVAGNLDTWWANGAQFAVTQPVYDPPGADEIARASERCDVVITSGGLGCMGFGLPAAIGAQAACPDRTVVDIAGDGSIQMNIQEMATAVECCLPVKVVILNNNYLGMVRQ